MAVRKNTSGKRARARIADTSAVAITASTAPPTPPPVIADDHHPDYLAGSIGEETSTPNQYTPHPDDPLPGPLPPGPFPPRDPLPFDPPRPGPVLPNPPLPVRFCGVVSGKYAYTPPARTIPGPEPVPLLNQLRITVRVDVDRFFPQQRISIEASRLIPRATAHVIAEVISDQCLSYNRRLVRARVVYRDGSTTLIPCDEILFEAKRTTGLGYGAYTITLSGSGMTTRVYKLSFKSRYFDPVEFEVDRVANAGTIVTSYGTDEHPNRPADLPAETVSLASVYQRSGFDVTMSAAESVIPVGDTGANGTWSDSEMHNAMQTYWSRFADKPNWAMWVLYAARHDQGRGLGGVMFDDIGPNHRQGTAIFTDSFIQDVPAGDAAPAAWRRRMQFWTAIHEMGHAFNLAHAWQKALGVDDGAPGDPWLPIPNEPESRSFMNYPFRVSGNESAFFSDFRFRFSDDELVFMRHAPRRFVQMGNSDWFVNHGFEAPSQLRQSGRFALALRPNRDSNVYAFLEPAVLEFKLTNLGQKPAAIDDHLLQDGRHVKVFVQREGGRTRQWRPLIARCTEEHDKSLSPGQSIYGAHNISASTTGWLIDEPGFYKIQAAVDVGDEVVVSNVLRLYVAPSAKAEENAIAPDYFTEDVARVLVFGGAPSLTSATNTLQQMVARCGNNPATMHATVALSSPLLKEYKELVSNAGAGFTLKSTKANVESAAKAQSAVLTTAPDQAAESMGHIPYFDALDRLAGDLDQAGNGKAAKKVLQCSVDTMKKRKVLDRVIKATEGKLAKLK